MERYGKSLGPLTACANASKLSVAVILIIILAMVTSNSNMNLNLHWPESAPAALEFTSMVESLNSSDYDARAAAFCSSSAGSDGNGTCDLARGRWVSEATPPLYTNDTCRYIHANQDCLTNGRPDREYLFWRWQPQDCELPRFDARLFLRLMASKRMLFVGDSLARNHIQALLCALAQVEVPQAVPDRRGLESMWEFSSHNFTMAHAWSSFLVRYTVENDTWNIHVDKTDEGWTQPLANYDIAIFSTTHWFYRRSIYYVKEENISSFNPPNDAPVKEIRAMKIVWNTVLQYLVDHYTGIAVLRTTSASHFNYSWNEGGTCKKTQPEFDPSMQMWSSSSPKDILEMQKEEFAGALWRRNHESRPGKLRLLDVTYNTLLRPDGHPAAYRIQSSTEPRADCTHWCSPGPIDTWNQLLLADTQIMCS